MGSSGIVNILSSSAKSFGTGFFVSPAGHILTCKHVLTEAGYTELGQMVVFKFANNASLYKAEWIASPKSEDLAILHTSEHSDNYIPIYHRDVTGLTLNSYGFPSNSYLRLKATVRVDCLFDNEKYLQLGNANAVTYGFSGAPVLYDDTAVGIIYSVTKTDSNGRLAEIAFAISAKHLSQLFPKYVVNKEVCIGYGEKAEKCNNYAISRSVSLCKECYKAQYLDAVKSLYTAQNYLIHPCDSFFVTELKYGASTYCDAVFTIVKFDEVVSPDDVYPYICLVGKCKYDISQMFIVTNAKLSEDCLKLVNEHKIRIRTKDELLRALFDFIPYRNDLRLHANSDELSSHYIQVNCTSVMNGKEPSKNANLIELRNGVKDDFGCIDEYGEYSDNSVQNDSISGANPKPFLKDYVNDFLRSSNRALLILGDYGSGKTSFCYTYALELLDKYIQEESTYLPIFIKLRSYNKAVEITQLLTDYFVNKLGISNFNTSSLKLLTKNIDVVFIFDGYDEVAKRVDFDIKYDVLKEICSLVEDRTKIILTCRPNFFQNASEFKRIFQSSHIHFEPGEKLMIDFIETSIADLSPEQVDFYIDSYRSELEKSNISISDMLYTISTTHDLTDLAKRPFLLYMILCTLPEILKEGKKSGDNKINASKLYSVYTDNWLRREDSKNKTLIKRADKEYFCKELALELYLSDSPSISYKSFPSTIKKHFSDIERIEEVDYFSHDIQSCSFLTSDRSGDFRFIHQSFMEYFIADRVITKLEARLIRPKNNKPIDEINKILGVVYLSMQICLFIIDLLEFQSRDILNDIITYYDDINSVSRSNLLSILAKTKTNISEFIKKHKESILDVTHVDFSQAIFRGETLVNISFNNIQFYSVTFDETIFSNCDFRGAVFYKCNFRKVKFNDCPFYSSKWKETKLTGCSFFSRDEYNPIPYERDRYGNSEWYGRSSKKNVHKSQDKDELFAYDTDFEYSSWSDSSISYCSFSGCSFVDSKMSAMLIRNSNFNYVDFSGLEVDHNSKFVGNILIDVIGEPYEL